MNKIKTALRRFKARIHDFASNIGYAFRMLFSKYH